MYFKQVWNNMVEQNARLKEHKLLKQNIKYLLFFPLSDQQW